jgi:hypothetical protein
LLHGVVVVVVVVVVDKEVLDNTNCCLIKQCNDSQNLAPVDLPRRWYVNNIVIVDGVQSNEFCTTVV